MIFALRRFFAAVRSPLGAYERGIVAFNRRAYETALREFERALADSITNADRLQAHNKCGITYVAVGDRARAVDAFTCALEIEPRYAPSIVNIGNLLLEDGDVEEAIAHYDAALRIDDRYAPAHRNLAVAYRRLGRRGAAVRELRLAARLEARGLFGPGALASAETARTVSPAV